MSSEPKCQECGIKATKQCSCGNNYCGRHFQMHTHPKGSGAGVG